MLTTAAATSIAPQALFMHRVIPSIHGTTSNSTADYIMLVVVILSIIAGSYLAVRSINKID